MAKQKQEKVINTPEKGVKAEKPPIAVEELEKILSGETPSPNEMVSYSRDQILEFRAKFKNEYKTLQRVNEEKNRLDAEAVRLTKLLDGYGARLQGLVHDLNHWL